MQSTIKGRAAALAPVTFQDPRETRATTAVLLSSDGQGWTGAVFNRLRVGTLPRDHYCYSNDMVAAVRSGVASLDWRCDGRTGRTGLALGDVSVQPAGRFLHSGSMPGVVCDTLNFAPGFVAAVATDDPASRNFTLIAAAGAADPLLVHFLDQLSEQVPRRGEYADPLAADEMIVRIAAHLVETRSTRPRRLKGYRRGLDNWRLRRVFDFIEGNIARRLTLGDLAGAAGGLSLHHFCRLFRQSTGVSPHRFVMRRRLLTARRMLAAGGGDLLTVALATGFCDHAHLTRRFRREFGLTPSEFVRRE